MSAVIRLLFVLSTCAIAQALAQSPASVEPEHPLSQSPAAAATASQPAATAQSSPADSAAKPDTSDKAPATQSSNATANAPAASGAMKTVLVDKTLTNAQVKQLLAKGYRPQGHGDEVYYCRREQELGSRFERKVCKTADQITRDELDSQELAENARKGMTSPSGR